jgi:hypothetical protein
MKPDPSPKKSGPLTPLSLYFFEDQKSLLLVKGQQEKGIFSLALKHSKNNKM